MLFDIKSRVHALNKKCVMLLPELMERGINTNPAQLSNSLHGYYKGGKYDAIVSACNEIVSEWEKEVRRAV